MTRSLAVIVPVFNDVGNVAPFVERAVRTLDAVPSLLWQIVLLNNGSTDGSFERACEVHRADGRVKVLSLSRNFGYHGALLAGRHDTDPVAGSDPATDDHAGEAAEFVTGAVDPLHRHAEGAVLRVLPDGHRLEVLAEAPSRDA